MKFKNVAHFQERISNTPKEFLPTSVVIMETEEGGTIIETPYEVFLSEDKMRLIVTNRVTGAVIHQQLNTIGGE